jgi:hypothetical protein
MKVNLTNILDVHGRGWGSIGLHSATNRVHNNGALVNHLIIKCTRKVFPEELIVL